MSLEMQKKKDGSLRSKWWYGRFTVKECRHVYACLAVSDQKALQADENCTDPKKTGCVLFPAHHTKADDILKSRGIVSVALRECLSIKPDGFHGECPVMHRRSPVTALMVFQRCI